MGVLIWYRGGDKAQVSFGWQLRLVCYDVIVVATCSQRGLSILFLCLHLQASLWLMTILPARNFVKVSCWCSFRYHHFVIINSAQFLWPIEPQVPYVWLLPMQVVLHERGTQYHSHNCLRHCQLFLLSIIICAGARLICSSGLVFFETISSRFSCLRFVWFHGNNSCQCIMMKPKLLKGNSSLKTKYSQHMSNEY